MNDEEVVAESVPEAESPQPVLDRKTMALRCKLTTDEWLARSRKLAQLLEERDAEEDAQGEEKRAMKGRLENLESEIRAVRRVVASAEEERNVEVEDHMDYENGLVLRHRLDTGQEIARRKMSLEEQQVGIPGV